jgi:type IV pilus assembly protein PilW
MNFNPLQLPFVRMYRACAGMTLVELTIGMGLGLGLLVGLISAYSSSTQSYNRMQAAAQQNEAGRYAIEELRKELQHAGFFGEYHDFPERTILPDPCSLTTTSIEEGLSFAVQGYRVLKNATSSPLSCLRIANIQTGSDIIVIRRVATEVLSKSNTPIKNEVYLQSNPISYAVQLGNATTFAVGELDSLNGVAVVGTTADGITATILKKANNADAITRDSSLRLAADIRKIMTHIYYVAPCSMPADGGEVCTGEKDDRGTPIPTLKRLELVAKSGALQFKNYPVVEGIERMQIDYGVDSDSDENEMGRGSPNGYEKSPDVTEWDDVVAIKVYLLSRDVAASSDYTDQKRFVMGLNGPTDATKDHFRRQLYTSLIRLNNVSGRREVPQ